MKVREWRWLRSAVVGAACRGEGLLVMGEEEEDSGK